MNKRQIPIIMLAMFSISLLAMFDYVVKPSYSVSASDFVFDDANLESFYMTSIDSYVFLEKVTASSASIFVLPADSESPSTDYVQYTVAPQEGGCEPINNPCDADTGTANCRPETFGDACAIKTGITGQFEALWCGLTDCFMWFDLSTGSWSNQLLRLTLVGEQEGMITGYMNYTSGAGIFPAMWGYDENTGGIGGITLWWTYDGGAGDATSHLVQTGGTSLMGNVDDDDLVITDTYIINSIDGCRNCAGVGGTTVVGIMASIDNAGTNRQGALFSAGADTITSLTEDNISAGSGGQIAGDTGDTGIITYLGNTQDSFLITTDVGFVEISRTGTYDATSDFLYATGSITNFPKAVEIGTDTYFIYHGSASSLSSVTQMSLTTLSQEVDFDADDATVGDTITGWVSGGQPYNSLSVAIEHDTIILTDDTVRSRLIYLDGFVGGDDPDNQGGVDCTLPANENILICRLGGNSTTVGIGGVISEGITDLGCNIVFVDCVDDNPQTNGIGLLIFIASIFVVIGMFYYAIGTEAFHMPLFIWIVIIIALSAFFTLTGIIDPVFLVLSIVAIVALTAPKVLTIMRGSTFGGGSTE